MIKQSASILIIFSCLFFAFDNISFSGTSITITNNLIPVTDIDTAEMASQIQHTTDLNGPFVADAFALANILGCTVGKAYIGSFPHFEFGLAAAAGFTNMKYFDKNDPAHDNGTLPMFAPNPVVHFGMGLFGGLDIIGKFFYISKSAVNRYKSDIDYETDVASLNDYMIYSTGARLRYNYIKKKTFLPFYLSFGGLTFSLGGHFMYGDISFIGNYEYDFEDVTINIPDPTEIQMNFNGDFSAGIHWAIFSLDAQAVAYFDILYLFSLYSGFGVSGNFGAFKLKFAGNGEVTTTDTNYIDYTLGSSTVGAVNFLSENKYNPAPVIPVYIIGLEINILVVKINLETMVNMLNRSDVNAQAGTRIQF